MKSIEGHWRRRIDLPDGGAVELERCDDAFFRKAQSLSIAIQLRDPALYSLTNPELDLPRIYVALTALTGPSGNLYDDWKGAFSFPFKLTVHRGDRKLRYLLNIMSFRSMAEPCVYRVLQEGEPYDRRLYHKPFDDELSEDALRDVLGYFCGFLAGFLTTMPKWTTPFLKVVQSNLILFGFDPTSGELFQQQFREPEAYSAAFEHWQTLIPKESLG